MGRAAALLSGRAAAFLALAGALACYYAWHFQLPNWSNWADVAFISAVLIPAVFGLVWLVLPLRTARGLLPVGASLAVLAYLLERADLKVVANFGKLAAMTLLAFWFLRFFETVGWVVVVASIIPWVDAYSVWRGPTHTIVTQRPDVFNTLSFAFPVPGEHTAANLGLPDLLFFTLFLAASVRFRLRPGWTWLALTISFGITIAVAVWGNFAGLPALPGLSIGFLAANGDLLWRQLRRPAT